MGEQAVQSGPESIATPAVVELLAQQAINDSLTHVCLAAPYGVWLGDDDSSGAIVASPLDPSDVSRGVLVRPVGPAALRGNARVEFRFAESTLRLHAAADRVGDGSVVLRPPWALQSRTYREQPRVDVTEGEVRWLEGGHVWSAPITDFSVDGLGARIRQDQHLPQESHFPLTIALADHTVTVTAELRRINVDGTGLDVGLSITSSGEVRRLLIEAYCRYRFPHLRKRSDFDAAAVDELFERSGYYALCRGMRPVDGWYSLRDGGRLSHDVVYCEPNGRPVGHISFTRSYPRSWTLHQVASLKDSEFTDDARRAMYMYTSVPLALDGTDIFLYCYYDRSKRWHKLLWEGFADWLGQPEHALVFELDRFEPPVGVASDPAFVIEPLGPNDDDAAVISLVHAGLPAIAIEAFDLKPGCLVRAELSPGVADTGLRRERRVITVRENGKVVGAALYEISSRDLSAFNIFNMAMLFFAAEATATARVQLGRAVVALYAKEDAGIPMLVTPKGAWPDAAAAGFTWVEAMGTMMWSGSALVHYQSYVATCFSKIAAARPNKLLSARTA